MKRWAILVALLYLLALIALTLPVVLLAFAPLMSLPEASGAFATWPYWVLLGILGLCQLCLLVVPVKIAAQRPVSQRALYLPIVTGGLLAGLLAVGATYSLGEFLYRDKTLDAPNLFSAWHPWAYAGFTWILWTLIFCRTARAQSAQDVVTRQCRYLLRGSILELLIAVPTHIVARCRNYCCAGFLTFIGLTFGIAVMLFAYGPAVFFLFVERWKRLHPGQPPSANRPPD